MEKNAIPKGVYLCKMKSVEEEEMLKVLPLIK